MFSLDQDVCMARVVTGHLLRAEWFCSFCNIFIDFPLNCYRNTNSINRNKRNILFSDDMNTRLCIAARPVKVP